MRHRWAILLIVGLSLGPYSVLVAVGGPSVVVGSRSGPTHHLRNVAGPYLFSLGLIVGSSLPHVGVIRVDMVWWAGRVLFDTLLLGETSALSTCDQRQGRKRRMPYQVGRSLLGPPLCSSPNSVERR
jgi:hypothetical protein